MHPLLLFLEFALAVDGASTHCHPKPLSLPITNVILSNGHTRRGVPASVGDSAHSLSFMVHTYLNNTWVYNTTDTFCGENVSDPQCLTWRGGLYDAEASTTHRSHADVFAAGGDPSDTLQTLGTPMRYSAWVTDEFVLNNETLSGFPIGMPGSDFGGPQDRQAVLGLGQNSTLLQRLKDENLIASRTWSYWWGIDNPESSSAMDGHLVLGGYDAAKAVGIPYTQPLQPPSVACQSGMFVPITNMILRFPNDTSGDINPSSSLIACIQTDFPCSMTIPLEPHFQRFQDITQTNWVNKSLGNYWYNPLYPPQNVYPGDLELHIPGGPTVTIPNDALVVPDQYTDSSGEIRANSSAEMLFLGPNYGVNSNDPLLIGAPFFSGAYLTVNLDNRTWSIWPVKDTTESRIIAIGEDCERDNNTFSGTTDSMDQPENIPSPGLSVAEIAGIVASAACAGLLLVGAVVYFIHKSRRARGSASHGGTSFESAQSSLFHPQKWNGSTQFLHYGASGVQEMSAGQMSPAELRADTEPVELACRNGRYSSLGGKQEVFELPAGRM